MIKGTKSVEGKSIFQYAWNENILTVHHIVQKTQIVIEGFDNFKQAWEHYKLITVTL